MDAVDPAARPALDPALPARFPADDRHLAHLLTRIGCAVKTAMPRAGGAAVGALYACGGWQAARCRSPTRASARWTRKGRRPLRDGAPPPGSA